MALMPVAQLLGGGGFRALGFRFQGFGFKAFRFLGLVCVRT